MHSIYKVLLKYPLSVECSLQFAVILEKGRSEHKSGEKLNRVYSIPTTIAFQLNSRYDSNVWYTTPVSPVKFLHLVNQRVDLFGDFLSSWPFLHRSTSTSLVCHKCSLKLHAFCFDRRATQCHHKVFFPFFMKQRTIMSILSLQKTTSPQSGRVIFKGQYMNRSYLFILKKNLSILQMKKQIRERLNSVCTTLLK